MVDREGGRKEREGKGDRGQIQREGNRGGR